VFISNISLIKQIVYCRAMVSQVTVTQENKATFSRL